MTRRAIDVYLEAGARRTFAGAIEWPGWCRSGRNEADAVNSLIVYAPRYARALGDAVTFEEPSDASELDVIERLEGDATTDFGAPGAIPQADARPLDGDDLARHTLLLQAAWRAFDAAMTSTAGLELRKGPRGGGRDHAGIAMHVLEAERSYLAQLGARHRLDGGDPMTQLAGLRTAVLETLAALSRGTLDRGGRPRKPWPARYFIRRAAWHVLDHAWEIEDRAGRG